MNSLKSGATSIDLSPKKFNGSNPFGWWSRQPVAQTRTLTPVFVEGRDIQDALQPGLGHPEQSILDTTD
jgi:hypothetical protein